jgi:flagellar biosynthesis/type III secretory pathway protein FliH
MDADQNQTSDPVPSLVKTFKMSSFQLTTWQVVAEGPSHTDFQPLAVETISHERVAIDPLFENYDNDVAPQPEEPVVDQDLAQQLQEEVVDEEQQAAAQQEELRIESERRAQEEEEARLVEHARQVEEARNAGLEQGRAEAAKESDERLQAIEQKYAAIIEDMQVQIREGIEAVERRGVDFCVQLTKKLIGASVELSREYILEAIQEAVKVTGGATIKAVRVNPQDLEFLNKLNPQKQFKEFDGTWSFQADDSIRAGCVVETSAGTVEYDLEKAWERIKDNVVKVR